MRLSAFSYWLDFVLTGAAILGFAVATLRDATLSGAAQWAAAAATGFIVWTLFEYFVHRVLYHNVPIFDAMHDAHHKRPNEFIGAPPVIGVVLVIGMSFVPLALLSFTLASGAAAGMLTGYLAYMTLHHAAHHWMAKPGSWLFESRRFHALHHHARVEGNYGITTSFWDRVFGTVIDL